jgi:hypothetical protein
MTGFPLVSFRVRKGVQRTTPRPADLAMKKRNRPATVRLIRVGMVAERAAGASTMTSGTFAVTAAPVQ